MKVLFLLFSLFISISFCKVVTKENIPTVKKGILDLTNWNLKTDGLLPLNGEWEFYPNELILPNQFIEKKASYYQVPSNWNSFTINGKEIGSKGFATYRLIVLFSEPQKDIALRVPEIYTSYEIFGNGELISRRGKVAKKEEEGIPEFNPEISAEPSDGFTKLEIVVLVSNYHHRRGGIAKEIQIGKILSLMEKREISIAEDLFLAGSIIIIGIYHFGLFYLRRKEKLYLYFAILCILVAIQTLISGERYFMRLFPTTHWEIMYTLDYLSTYPSLIFFTMFLRELFIEDFSIYVVRPIQIIFCFGCLPVLFGKSILYSSLNPYFEILIIISFILLLWILVKAGLKKREGANLILFATLGVFAAVINDILFGRNIIPTLILVPYSIFFLFFAQSFLLSIRYTGAFLKVESLSSELERSNRSLEEKVFARTSELYDRNFELKLAKVESEKAYKIKSEFLSNMSHEIRTPMNGVIGMANILSETEMNAIQRDYLKTITVCGETILTIINDILDLSKIESDQIRLENNSFSIEDCIKESISIVSPKLNKDVVLGYEIASDLSLAVNGDITRLRQILLNLLGNSVKFTNSGFISIKASIKEETSDSFLILFEVADTGIGISLDKQDMIFESFTQSDSSITRKFGGTGLGLTITKKLVLIMGGTIGVKSKEGNGSIFYFTIFFGKSFDKKKSENIPSNQFEKLLESLYPFKILLVEDNQVNQKVASKFLSRLGYKIDIAGNGKEAIAMVTTKAYDLIFMDIGMPEMDGVESTSQIRSLETRKHIIIAMTANIDEEDKNKYLSKGMDDFIGKPIYFDELAKKIRLWGTRFFAS